MRSSLGSASVSNSHSTTPSGSSNAKGEKGTSPFENSRCVILPSCTSIVKRSVEKKSNLSTTSMPLMFIGSYSSTCRSP